MRQSRGASDSRGRQDHRKNCASCSGGHYVRESFHEKAELHANDDGGRSLRCLDWAWDPEPTDDTYDVEYAFLLRHDAGVRAVHDHHVKGLFARATWFELLEGAGFRVELVDRPFDDTTTDSIFLCRRP